MRLYHQTHGTAAAAVGMLFVLAGLYFVSSVFPKAPRLLRADSLSPSTASPSMARESLGFTFHSPREPYCQHHPGSSL